MPKGSTVYSPTFIHIKLPQMDPVIRVNIPREIRLWINHDWAISSSSSSIQPFMRYWGTIEDYWGMILPESIGLLIHSLIHISMPQYLNSSYSSYSFDPSPDFRLQELLYAHLREVLAPCRSTGIGDWWCVNHGKATSKHGDLMVIQSWFNGDWWFMR